MAACREAEAVVTRKIQKIICRHLTLPFLLRILAHALMGTYLGNDELGMMNDEGVHCSSKSKRANYCLWEVNYEYLLQQLAKLAYFRRCS